jgi:hypothetical protein
MRQREPCDRWNRQTDVENHRWETRDGRLGEEETK